MAQGKEHPPKRELDPDLCEAYAHTFIHRTDCYPMQLDAGTSYVTIKKPLTTELLTGHIRGTVTLGAYALDEQSHAHWLCLDADDQEQWDHLKRLAQQLMSEGIIGHLELSRRGGHLWLFTDEIDGKTIRRFGKQLIDNHNLDPKIELYPKQNELKDNGVGSLVRLPLGVHRITGKRYYFITPEGEPLAPTIREQMAVLGKPERIPQAYIHQVLSQVSPPQPHQKEVFARVSYPDGGTLSQRIKRAITVYEFVSRYVDLDDRGKGHCPFHDDEHTSFGVNIQKNYWSCYAGCGGGSVIDFWMRWREMHGQDGSFTATIKDLMAFVLSQS